MGLLALAGALLFLTLRPSKPAGPGVESAVAEEAKKTSVREKEAARAERKKDPARAKETKRGLAQEETAEAGSPAVSPSEAKRAAASAEVKTPREKAVAAWEALVDQVIEQKDVAVDEQSKRVKEAFDKLDKEDQMDGIRRSLNLFPDEQFPALYAILYDKTENPEILDAIFSDALNRPEEIKNPLMKELRKDREHPMFFESARILDVVEPKEEKP